MAKRLLLNALLDVFGDYIEGLSQENLKLGVWSGKLSLSNLALNQEAFQKLALPVSIHHGTVQSLQVSIPWSKLDSQPVKVELRGVFLQVGPLSTETLDPVEIERRMLEDKRKKLLQVEKHIEEKKTTEDQKGKKKSAWVERLTTKIIDNLIVTVKDIHIRYEDSVTYPGSTFAAGITLDAFTISTTDEQWQESFLTRPKAQQEGTCIHKVAKGLCCANCCRFFLKLATSQSSIWRRTGTAMHEICSI
jgi:vacuolar protein sorting-associated protein 13A/C